MALYFGNQQISALSADTASKTWVGQQGYLTSDDVSNLISENDASIYLTESDLEGYVTSTDLGNLSDTVSDLSTNLKNNYLTDSSIAAAYQAKLVSGTNIKTVNNQSLLGEGNLTIDLTIYEIVQTLPSEDINENKIYLVPMSDGSTATNQFDEYVYANSEWEKIGTVQQTIDLTGYLTIADASANFVTNASLDESVSALNYVKSSTLNDYLLSSTASSTYATISSLDDYVSNASLDDDVSALGYIKSDDVSNFVTNSSVSATYATKTEISGFKNIVQCTDAEYAALVQAGTVDANTVYLTYTASA